MRETIAELNEDALFLAPDEFDRALIGYVERFGMEAVPLYDRATVIEVLMDWGMDEEDAEEYFSFNTIGAWMGEGTPAFATLLEKDQRDGRETDDRGTTTEDHSHGVAGQAGLQGEDDHHPVR